MVGCQACPGEPSSSAFPSGHGGNETGPDERLVSVIVKATSESAAAVGCAKVMTASVGRSLTRFPGHQF